MSFFGELRRRNVDRVGIAYLAAVWVLIQVSDTVLPVVNAPPWVLQALVFSAALGFPLALVLAWFYEWTSEGIKVSGDVATIEAVKFTGRKLDFVIIGLLVLAVGFLVVDDLVSPERERSIAVLPFDDESAAGENAEFFANGVQNELLSQLAKIGSLKVISRPSVEVYRDSIKSIREIGRELGVATILVGAVQRAADTVRITVQLVDAETDEQLWGETFDRALTAENIFAIQTEAARSIIEELDTTLSPQEAARLAEVPTQNLRAYDFYLSGNEILLRQDELTALPLAARQFELAVEEDSGFALAWAALARVHSALYFFRVDPSDDRRARALDAVERAFELAPGLPEAHFAMGVYHYHGSRAPGAQPARDYENALRELAIAESGMPGNPLIHIRRALIDRRTGQFEQANASLDRAIELDPRGLEQQYNQAVNYLLLREYAQAERNFDRMIEIAPDAVEPHVGLALTALFRDGEATVAKATAENSSLELGDWEQRLGWMVAIYEQDFVAALSYLDDWDTEVDVRPGYYAPIASYYGVTHQLAGEAESAARQFEIARAQVDEYLESNPADAWHRIALGETLAGLGDPIEAEREAREALKLMPTSRDAIAGPDQQINAVVRILIPAGEYETAIEELDAYLTGPGWWSIEGLLPDPRLDPIREDPRFQALVEKYRRQ